MDDTTRTALDVEAPVNPYSLLDALNAASARSSTLWLLFLALMAYLLVAAAGVTHRDLLLDTGVVLPLLQARIDLARFFVLAPAVLALLHLGLVAQLVLLARKTHEFHNALRLLESTDRRTHPLRLEVDSFFFVQALAGPERSRFVSGFLNAIGWTTVVVLPLFLLLYLQIAFLPVHDAVITSVQRAILLADVVLLGLVGVFLLRTETGWLGAFLRLGIHNPGSLVFGLAVLAGTAFVSLFLATIPGGPAQDDRASVVAAAGGPLFGLFPRNLVVTNADLVGEGSVSEWTSARTSISLRGRDLRFARLERVNLRQADLSGANLDGASLAGAYLGGARLGCAEGATPQPSDDRRKAQCTSARGADFSGARLFDAKLAGADLRGAKLDDAGMERVDLSRSLLSGASFDRASLSRADLSGALSAGHQLRARQPAGRQPRRRQIAGRRLLGRQPGGRQPRARLSGGRGAARGRPGGRRAAVGQALRRRPARRQAAGRGPRRRAGVACATSGRRHGGARRPRQHRDAVARQGGRRCPEGSRQCPEAARRRAGAECHRPTPRGGLGGSADGQAWSALHRASEAAMADGYRTRLTVLLGRLACSARFADGAVASGLARRASGQSFKGEPAPLYERLKAADCPAARNVPPRLLLDLAAAIEAKKAE